jgi:hypothetical protein
MADTSLLQIVGYTLVSHRRSPTMGSPRGVTGIDIDFSTRAFKGCATLMDPVMNAGNLTVTFLPCFNDGQFVICATNSDGCDRCR